MQIFSAIALILRMLSINVMTWNNVDKRILSSDISVILNCKKQFPKKSCSNECHEVLESFYMSKLKNPGIQTQNGLQYGDFNQRWYGHTTDIFAKIHKKKNIL